VRRGQPIAVEDGGRWSNKLNIKNGKIFKIGGNFQGNYAN
jgi:hypothetical protein